MQGRRAVSNNDINGLKLCIFNPKKTPKFNKRFWYYKSHRTNK